MMRSLLTLHKLTRKLINSQKKGSPFRWVFFYLQKRNDFLYLLMIFIYKQQSNQRIVLTVGQTATLTSPSFLFEFTPDFGDGDTIYFTTPDVSAHPNRYNLFLITESNNGSKTGGNNVALNLDSGQYTYKIYETNGVSTNPNDIVGEALDEGIMFVELKDDDTSTIYD